jgi:hypothetical protein
MKTKERRHTTLGNGAITNQKKGRKTRTNMQDKANTG